VRESIQDEVGFGTPDYMSPEIFQAIYVNKTPIILNNE
jgi:hypothetical protein